MNIQQLNEKKFLRKTDLKDIDFSLLDQEIIDDLKPRQIIWHLLNNTTSRPLCNGINCENKVRYNNRANIYNSYCGSKCSSNSPEVQAKNKATTMKRFGVENASQATVCKEKRKSTMLDRYGVEFASQSSVFIDKRKQTTIDRYGVDHVLQVKEFRDKGKSTCQERYGVDNPFQNKEIQDKQRATMLERHGVEHAAQSKVFQDKQKQTTLDRYGVEHAMQLKEVQDKAAATKMKLYGVEHQSQRHISKESLEILKSKEKLTNELKDKNIKDVADNLKVNITSIYVRILKYDIEYNSPGSYLESDMKSFLTELNVKFKTNNRKILNGKELDFYLPEYNIAIEMNGGYWHSDLFRDKDYHYDKWKMCQDQNIQLISAAEDAWNLKQDIVKLIIKKALNLCESTVNINVCNSEPISVEESALFLNQYHIHGFANGQHYGAYYKDQLIGVMTFNHNELIRFTTNEYTYNGLFSKLFKFAHTDLDFNEVVSFSDNRWFTGNEYVDFDYIGTLESEFRYLYRDVLIHDNELNSNEVKEKYPDLNESALTNIPKVYDCGKKKWAWTK